jgi:hypothetical protein
VTRRRPSAAHGLKGERYASTTERWPVAAAPDDPERLAKKLSGIDASAANAGVACRFGDDADGTIIDYDTGLQWEQKTEDGATTLHGTCAPSGPPSEDDRHRRV